MSKLLVVFGATGQQGGSVINTVLNDPELSKQYKIRAITRDSSKPTAQALKQNGVEIVLGDVGDKSSLPHALEGAHTVFGVTFTQYDEQLKSREVAQGKSLANAVVAAGASYLIFSTTAAAGKLSGYPVDAFDAKADVEEYIRTLRIKSAFYAPGAFMQNFSGGIHMPRPDQNEAGVYNIANIMAPETELPLIDVADDSGKYVGAILADPEKYEGKVFWAATKLYSLREIAETISKATGKTVRHKQLPEKVWSGFLPPVAAPNMVSMMVYYRDCGYYGPETKQRVEWTAQQARGKLTTFDEYLAKNPIELQ